MTDVALCVITNRGFKYLPRMMRSLQAQVGYPWSHRVVVDDAGGLRPYDFEGFDYIGHDTPLGGAAAINAAWHHLEHLPHSPDYVFHVEEDWTFPARVDVDEMVAILEADHWLAQVALRRQPAAGEGPGGYIGDDPGGFTQAHLGESPYLVHRKGFWLNPCLYPLRVTYGGWPDHGHEHHFTRRLIDEGYHFGILGTHDDAPRVEHIGYDRAGQWQW